MEDDQVDETGFLPPGELLKVHPDEPRNFSKLLVKIHEQRHILQKSKPTSAVPQLAGHFVHAARYRSLPASRFEDRPSDRDHSEVGGEPFVPEKQERSGSDPGPAEEFVAEAPSTSSTFKGTQADTISALDNTLFRHQVRSNMIRRLTSINLKTI